MAVVVIAGALLKQCQTLLAKGVHPTVISEALHKASEKAVEVSAILTESLFIIDLTQKHVIISAFSAGY